MTKSDDVTGVILAGGRSRRFGADKAAVVVDGRPMIEHVYEAVRAVTDRLFLSARTADEAPALLVPTIVDRYPDRGPLAGLHAALRAAGTTWVLVVACDLPYVTPRVLRQILDARASGGEAVVSRTPDGRLQPLCACYHLHILPMVERRIASGAFSMHELLTHLESVRYVDVPAAPLRNVNTPEDLAD